MAAKGEGGPKDENAGASAADRACKAKLPVGCVLYGLFARDGLGTTKDLDAARASFHQACAAGNEDGCRGEEEMKPAASATASGAGANDIEGADLTMSGLDADGVKLRDIACRTGGAGLGGLFGGITVAAGFKARKAKLDACSPKAVVETRVKWTSNGGRMGQVHALGKNAAMNACIEKALAGAVSTMPGVCAATVVHGKK